VTDISFEFSKAKSLNPLIKSSTILDFIFSSPSKQFLNKLTAIKPWSDESNASNSLWILTKISSVSNFLALLKNGGGKPKRGE
jgi:hypothetical protein